MNYIIRQLKRIKDVLGIPYSTMYKTMAEELSVDRCSSISTFYHFIDSKRDLQPHELLYLEEFIEQQLPSVIKFEAFLYRITNNDGATNEEK